MRCNDAAHRCIPRVGSLGIRVVRRRASPIFRCHCARCRTQVLRWQETNIEFGFGEFNVENHPKRVLRKLFQVHNADGWSV